MKRPICVAALAAVTAVAGATHAADAKVPEAREVVSTTAVDVARVPTFELPPPLKDTATAPAGAEASGLQLGSTPGEVEKWRKNPFQAASFLLKGESAAFSVQLAGAQTSLAREALWVSCDAHGRRSFQALRWETLVVDASGQATWSIHDGFLDPKTCRIFRERVAEIHPKAVASFGNHTLAFAARSDEGMTFLLPSTDAVAGDASPSAARVTRGTLPRVTLPIARGSSASAVAFVDIARLLSWLLATGAKGEGIKEKAPRGITVRIDATQTVGEDAPTVIVRTSAAT